MKAMSIIGIIFFSIFIFVYFMGDFPPDNSIYSDAFGCGFFGVLYGLAYAITGLVYSGKNPKARSYDITVELSKLSELKDKGILTEEEFTDRKNRLLEYD